MALQVRCVDKEYWPLQVHGQCANPRSGHGGPGGCQVWVGRRVTGDLLRMQTARPAQPPCTSGLGAQESGFPLWAGRRSAARDEPAAGEPQDTVCPGAGPGRRPGAQTHAPTPGRPCLPSHLCPCLCHAQSLCLCCLVGTGGDPLPPTPPCGRDGARSCT